MNSLKTLDTDRIRALDAVENSLDDWRAYNDLFDHFTKDFDEIFSSDYNNNRIIDELYVERFEGSSDQSFEDKMVDLLFFDHNLPEGKIYVLTGDVGTGKTTFIKYLCEKKIRVKYKENLLFVYMDMFSSMVSEATSFSDVEISFLEKLKSQIWSANNSKFRGPLDFAKFYLKKNGIDNVSIQDIISMSETISRMSLSNFLNFILGSCEFTHVIFVIDNIDEGNFYKKTAGGEFARYLKGVCSDAASSAKTCIILPARTYTRNEFFSTDHYFCKKMPQPPASAIIAKRIYAMRNRFSQYIKNKSHSVEIYRQDKHGQKKFVTAKNVRISPETAHAFLMEVLKILDLTQERPARYMLLCISNKNMKILMKIVYYLFHSCKLNYLPIFQMVFGGARMAERVGCGEESIFPIHLIIECLMAIHYPFYDKDASPIANIFNADISTNVNDYRNTLVISRIMFFLKRRPSVEYEEILKEFYLIGYDTFSIRQALNVLLKYGLVEIDVGYTIEHVRDNSKIKVSMSGEFYVNCIFTQVRYIELVVADIVMPKKFVIPLNEIHPSNNADSKYPAAIVKSKIRQAVRNFVAFLRLEEEREWEVVKSKSHLDRLNFMAKFGPPGGQPVSIADCLTQAISRQWS